MFVPNRLRKVITEEEIDNFVRNLATSLSIGNDELTILAIPDASAPFALHLMSLLPRGMCALHFLPKERGPWEYKLNLEGQKVVLLDTLIDTGRTMQPYVRIVLGARPKAMYCAALCYKKSVSPAHLVNRCITRPLALQPEFLIGYGLDYCGFFRDLPYIASVTPEILPRRESALPSYTP